MIPLFKVSMAEDAADRTAEVLASGYIGQGPKVEQFEQEFQQLVQTDARPVLVNSCTSALTLALKLCGVGPGDEVVTTPMSCFASPIPVVHLGAKIIWADVDPHTGLIDPRDVAEKVTRKTKAILAVDWAGRNCDYKSLKGFGVPVIQDAAHRLYLQKERGDICCWSFQAIKFLTMGDGGALLVPGGLRQKTKLLRWFGLDREKGESFRCSQDIELPGYKFQPNDILAAVGLANIPMAVEGVRKSRENAEYYHEALAGIDGLELPLPDPECNWWLYTVLVPGRRDDFIREMEKLGVACSQVHRRCDEHTVFAEFKSKTPLPGLDTFSQNEVAIPVGPWLDEDTRSRVAAAVRAAMEFLRENK